MPVTTPSDLITLALKHAMVTGVGQTPLAENMNDAFSVLNMMLGQWNRRRWLVYHQVDVSTPSTGAQAYAIGPGSAFNVTRANGIEAAYARRTAVSGSPVDYPLMLLTREDYNNVRLKSLAGFPAYAFLDAAYPTGQLYVWPIPAAGQWELHIILKDTLAAFTGLTQSLNLPPEYTEALLYNLAVRLRSQYGEAPDSVMTALARASLETIREANVTVPILRMPLGLRGGRYDINSDQTI